MIDLASIPNSSNLMVDLHCHPSIKPFGRAYPQNQNSSYPDARNSIWKFDHPRGLDRCVNKVTTLTKFSQANFTAMYLGNVRVALCALNPIERSFFRSCLGTGLTGDLLYNLATGIGRRKINFIQSMENYWAEFIRERDFYAQLDNFPIEFGSRILRYKLTKNYSEVDVNLSNPDIISVVFTVEGAYIFNEICSGTPDQARTLANIDDVKRWPHVPFFVSLMHHYYNHLGGHAKSFHGIVDKVCNQSFGMGTGLTPFGREVIRKLLKRNAEKRIHIDIKHMNCRSRMDYYDLLDNEYSNETEKPPVFVSHGALNGYPSINCDIPDDVDNGDFYGGNVNFCDDEIIRITQSNGVFGLQLDDRLLSSKSIKREARKGSRQEKLKKIAGIIWNQIRHAAEVLDENGLDAWGTVAMGTDYDGIVDPPNGYWTSAELPLLYCNLFGYVRDYLKPGNCKLHMASNYQRSEDEIMQNLFSENARRFMARYYV